MSNDEPWAEVDRLAEEKAAAYHESACSYRRERDALRAAVANFADHNPGMAWRSHLRALLGDPDAALRVVKAQAWDECLHAVGDAWADGDQVIGNPYRADRIEGGADDD